MSSKDTKSEKLVNLFLSVIQDTIDKCDAPGPNKIMALLHMRLKSAKHKKEFKRMAKQSELFSMLTNKKDPKSISPHRSSHIKMPDLKPITIRKKILDDVNSSKFSSLWEEGVDKTTSKHVLKPDKGFLWNPQGKSKMLRKSHKMILSQEFMTSVKITEDPTVFPMIKNNASEFKIPKLSLMDTPVNDFDKIDIESFRNNTFWNVK